MSKRELIEAELRGGASVEDVVEKLKMPRQYVREVGVRIGVVTRKKQHAPRARRIQP